MGATTTDTAAAEGEVVDEVSFAVLRSDLATLARGLSLYRAVLTWYQINGPEQHCDLAAADLAALDRIGGRNIERTLSGYDRPERQAGDASS